MMEVKSYITLPEVVPQAELRAWQEKMRARMDKFTCPDEVREFIIMMATKLGDFGDYRKFKVYWRGRDLYMDQFDGEKINSSDLYPVDVPVRQAVDHYTTMLRIYKKRGKAGLIDFCKVKTKHTEIERVLQILHVAVFHEDRPEFKQMMMELEKAKKLESA